MREVVPRLLWLGHAGDARDPRALFDAGIAALVDLALNEPQPSLPRELIYCRFPLVDGSGNRTELLQLAVETTAALLRTRTPTLVCCSAGMSRSLAIASAAWAVVQQTVPNESLRQLARSGPHDLSPALWRELTAACFPATVEPGLE